MKKEKLATKAQIREAKSQATKLVRAGLLVKTGTPICSPSMIQTSRQRTAQIERDQSHEC